MRSNLTGDDQVRNAVDWSDQPLETVLLASARLCGTTWDAPRVHRLQIFFVANFVCKRLNAEEDFQSTLNNEVKRSGIRDWTSLGSGVYEITGPGYSRFDYKPFVELCPLFRPAGSIDDVRYAVRGAIGASTVLLRRLGRLFKPVVDEQVYPSAVEACHVLGLAPGDNAVRALYNCAARNQFEIAE